MGAEPPSCFMARPGGHLGLRLVRWSFDPSVTWLRGLVAAWARRRCPSCGSGPARLILEAVQSAKCCREAEVAGTADGATEPALGVLTSSPCYAPTPGDDSRANCRAVGSSSARRRRRGGGVEEEEEDDDEQEENQSVTPHRPASPRLARQGRAALQRHLQEPAEAARTVGVREHGRHPARPAAGADGAEPDGRRQRQGGGEGPSPPGVAGGEAAAASPPRKTSEGDRPEALARTPPESGPSSKDVARRGGGDGPDDTQDEAAFREAMPDSGRGPKE